VAIAGINPHFVIVAPGTLRDRSKAAAAIQSAAECSGEKINFIFVVGSDLLTTVISGSATELAVSAHHLPVIAAIVGAPERTAWSGLAAEPGAIPGLDQRVDAARILGRHAPRDAAHGRVRQPALFQSLPGRSSVARFEQPAARTAAVAAPSMDFDLPHAGE